MINMKKKERENDESLIRRFGRKVQQSGVLKEVRSRRFHKRAKSKDTLRSAALYRAKMHTGVAYLKKMGRYTPDDVRELRKQIKQGD